MKTVVTRPALWPLLVCFFCGGALLTVGLYRWPPGRSALGSSPSSSLPQQAGDKKPGEILKGIADYFLAALGFTGGLVLWRRRSPKGYRLGDLWGRRWAGGKALWLLLNLHFVGSLYSLLLLVGLVLSLF